MIKVLRKKFIRTAMLAVTVLLVLLLGAINFINLGMVQRDLKDTLQMVADRVDKPDNDLVNTAYFLVQIDGSGSVVSTDVTHVTGVDEEQAASYALKVYEKYSIDTVGQENIPAAPGEQDVERPLPQAPKANEAIPEENAPGNSGSIPDAGNSGNLSGKETDTKTAMRDPMSQSTGRNSGYLYLAHPDTTGQGITDIVFLDPQREELSCLRVFALSVGLGVVCLAGMYLFVRRLSSKAIEPIAESMEKQRQFITDAGHELKTPLAIILSNTEAMELYQGESKWSRNIREQVGRLDGLTKNLLLLSRMEEYSENVARDVPYLLMKSSAALNLT
jgi:two-component system sensor histidine kinase CiaH